MVHSPTSSVGHRGALIIGTGRAAIIRHKASFPHDGKRQLRTTARNIPGLRPVDYQKASKKGLKPATRTNTASMANMLETRLKP
jgi:hypothetical protein